jgi:uncharacterized protein
MNYLDRFRINFGSLPIGEHEFEFEIDDKFFEQFENSPVQRGFFDVLVTVNKQEHILLFDFTIEGSIVTQCDRCGEDMDVETNGYNELTVKFGEEMGEVDADVIIISPKEHELNVAQFIYEYIALMMPLRRVHENDENGNSTCNPETINKLESLLLHEEEAKPADPRWEILKKINLN